MSNPLSLFRRHQKVLLAIFGVVIMFTFTVGSIVTRYQGQSRAREDAVVVRWKHGKVTEADIREMRSYHIQTVRFLDSIVSRAIAAGGDPKAAGLRRDPNGQIRDPGIPRSSAEEDMVRTMVLARKAREMGMDLSDDTVLEFIDRLSDGKVPRSALPQVLRDATSGGFAEQQLLEQMRTELMAQQMGMLAASGLLGITPDSAWDYFNRMHRRLKVELLPFSADELKSDVKEEPTAAEVQQLFDAGKDRLPQPSSPEPGFKRRRKIAFEYLKADYNKFLEKEMAAVTEQQVEEYYKKHLDDFKEPELPATEEPKTDTTAKESPQPKTESPGKAKPEAKSAPGKPESAKPIPPKPEPTKPAAGKSDPAESQPTKPEPTKPTPPKPETAKPEPAKPAAPKSEPAKAQPAARPATGAQKVDPAKPKEAAKGTSWTPASRSTFVSLRVFDGASSDDQASSPGAPAAKPQPESKPAAPAGKPPTDAKTTVPEPKAAGPKQKPEQPQPKPTGTPAPPKADGTKPAETPAKPKADAGETTEPSAKDAAKSKPVKHKPLEKVRDEIRRSLAREPAQKKVNQALKTAREAVEEYYKARTRYDSLTKANLAAEKPAPLDREQLAEKLGLVAGETPKVDELGITDFEIGRAYRFSFDQRQVRSISFAEMAYAEGLPLYRPEQIRSFDVDVEFLYWKIEEDEPYVPELDKIRAEVVDVWRLRRAFQLARAEAEKLAKTLKGDAALKDAVSPEQAQRVLVPGEFSWLTRGSMPMGYGAPVLSRVDGVEAAGVNFMRQVFALKPQEVGVVYNQPETAAYVVRIVSESPPEEKRREQFLQSGLTMDAFQQAALEREAFAQKWFQELEQEMKVKWERPPHALRDLE
jgi:hypothetical protein